MMSACVQYPSGSGSNSLAITTSSLPNGTVAVAYSTTLSATGGTRPLTWSLTSGTLPSGLALSGSGALTGTPSVAVSKSPLTFMVTDSGSPAQSKSVSLTLTIAPAALTVTTSSLPSGTVGVAYSTTLAATGGTQPLTWSLTSGTLPTGLSLTGSSGAITGTPTASANAAPLTFTVTDSSSPALTRQVSLTLTIAPVALTITTNSLPSGAVGVAYTTTLAATGGTAPLTWSLTSGTLPTGLSLHGSTGVLSGTPTAAVNATPLTFTVTDSSSTPLTKHVSLTLTISPVGLSITTSSLPTGSVNASYTATLAATGGTQPYTWSLTSGTLPTGLSLHASTGVISGTPSVPAHVAALTFTVTDSSTTPLTKQVNLTLTITPLPLSISTSSLPSGEVDSSYTATLAGTGGTQPYTWTLTSGDLPSGLILHPSTGVISGTPAVAANAIALTFTLADSSTPALTSQVNLTLTVIPIPLSISTSSLPTGQVGVAYSASLTADDGTLPYTWSLTAGTLPANLSLNASTGAITGTPTTPVSNTSLTFKVTDSSNPVESKSVTLSLTIAAQGFVITTASLPDGQVGVAYSATLTATGGTQPYTWALTSGTLPSNLSLNTSTGAITGTPGALIANTPLSFTVTDSSSPKVTKTANLTLSIVSVIVSPMRAGLAINQALSLSATIQDNVGVSWSASGSSCSGAACGVFSSTTSKSGVGVTYTAPSTAGEYTITATSISDTTVAASIPVGVTDLAGVDTYHNDGYRDGVNSKEYALTTSNVAAATFGKLASCPVDGAIYTQPLWVPNLTINSVKHNVVIVGTMADSVYAFDADTSGSCTPLWHASLLDTAHGAHSGETPPIANGPDRVVGGGGGDISPEVGVLSTPVIDPTTNTIYVVSKSVIVSGPTLYQRLHALDLFTGNEKFSGPAVITATVPGTATGGSSVTFNPQTESQRSALALTGGVVYLSWASHEDSGVYSGWLIGYKASNLTQSCVFNVTPNVNTGGIWMSGGGPAFDSSSNIFVATANGQFDVTNASPPNNDYGDSFLKLTPGLSVDNYFTPSDELTDEDDDRDFGSGAVTLLDLPANGGNPTHLALAGGKDGTIYLLNRDNPGGFGNSSAWQSFSARGAYFGTGAFWNKNFYITPAFGNTNLEMFSLNPTTAQMNTSPVSATSHTFGFPGSSPSISATPSNTNAILWVLDNSQYCTTQSPGCGPAVLYAYDATNLNELWDSTQGSGNSAGYAVKFQVPTVANGKVYVGTRGNNTGNADNSTSTPGELDIYGLLPN